MLSEQRIRVFLFYSSVIIFFLGLPFILSFTLDYKFDQHTFKFTKAGLIALKTQPQGASIYLDEKLLNEKTPATINELLPGRYNLRLELENHYPWISEVNVEAGKVTRLEKIILFPLRPNIKQLNKDMLSSFWVDEEKGELYYINPQDNSIYKSDLDGERPERVSEFIQINPAPLKWKLSPDRGKLLYFNTRQVGIVYLKHQQNESFPLAPPFVLDYSNDKLIDVFWHSDSYHLILISQRSIEAQEAKPEAKALVLVNLNKKDTTCFYDAHTDTLYFLDSQKGANGNLYDNLYKLDLSTRIFPLEELIKLKPNE